MLTNKKINLPKFCDVLSIPSTPEELFTLICPIGNGGFGKVYKAIHNSSKEIFAIKIIDYMKGCNNDKSNISFNYKSIQQETSVMRLIHESNYIVNYYGSYFSRDSNSLWLILEYCSSGSAVDLMLSMGRTLSEVEVATIIEMVLKGLIQIHEINLIHRDIKGANILLSEDGYAKLGDFGVGIQMTNEEYRTSKKGSPYWMSPQVVLSKNYDTKTDIWSLGITCLELVEGEPPYGEMKPAMVMEKIANDPPKAEDIIDVNEHTDDFVNFVNLCLEVNPINRPSAKELIKHPFITKLAKGKKYLKKLVEEHLNEVEKFRIEEEEYLNNRDKKSKNNLSEENEAELLNENDLRCKTTINNFDEMQHSNYNNTVNNKKNYINDNDDVYSFESYKSKNIDENNNNSNTSNNFSQNNDNDKNVFINDITNSININDEGKVQIPYDGSINKSYYNKCSRSNGISDISRTNSSLTNIKNNENKKIKNTKYNNNELNSNGGYKFDDFENINDMDEKLHVINHCLSNINQQKNKLDKTYDYVIMDKYKNKNDNNKNLKIPPLNLDKITAKDKNKKGEYSNIPDDLDSYDSPTHLSSFYLCNVHKKYFG